MQASLFILYFAFYIYIAAPRSMLLTVLPVKTLFAHIGLITYLNALKLSLLELLKI